MVDIVFSLSVLGLNKKQLENGLNSLNLLLSYSAILVTIDIIDLTL